MVSDPNPSAPAPTERPRGYLGSPPPAEGDPGPIPSAPAPTGERLPSAPPEDLEALGDALDAVTDEQLAAAFDRRQQGTPVTFDPTDDQPTWTVDKTDLILNGEIVTVTLSRDGRSLLDEEEYAALVEAVHRSQQLGTALDVINRLNGGWWQAVPAPPDGPAWETAPPANNCSVEPMSDAERAVLAQAERRHRG